MDIVNFKQKISYAFEGLPFENIDGTDKLPWSKCLVLTNNFMSLLKFPQLPEEFKQYIPKLKAEIEHGVSCHEYLEFIDYFLQKQFNISFDECLNRQNDRNNSVSSMDQISTSLETDYKEKRQRSCSNNNSNVSNSPFQYASMNRMTNDNNVIGCTESFDDYCWTLYRTKHIPELTMSSNLNKCFMRLWNLFIQYSIRDSKCHEVEIPVKMDFLEAKYWLNSIQEHFGGRRIIEELECEEEMNSINYLQFYGMIIDLIGRSNLDENLVEMSIENLCDQVLDGVIIKGRLKIDKNIRYCLLKSNVLYVYNNKNAPTNLRNTVIIEKSAEIKTGVNRINLKPNNHQNCLTITIEVTDNIILSKWRAALSESIQLSKQSIDNAYFEEAIKRQKLRQTKRENLRSNRLTLEQKLEEEIQARTKATEDMEKKLTEADEELRTFKQKMEEEQKEKENLLIQTETIRLEKENRIKEILSEQQILYEEQLSKLKIIEEERNDLNKELEMTREEKFSEENKRVLLEEKHSDAQNQLIEAEQKILELQQLRQQLEKALDEERQAKEDEESVRIATLKLLEEELNSKEKLEQMLEQQKNLTDQEILKRNEFALELEAEKNRIQQIANEKGRLAQQLEDSQERMKNSGQKVKRLDSKVAKIADTVFGSSETRAPVSHRGHGFLAEVMSQNYKMKSVSSTANQASPSDDQN